MTPTGRPSMPDQRRHHAAPEVAAQLEHRAVVGQRLDDVAHVVDAQPVLRHDVAHPPLVGAVQSASGPGSRRGTAWPRRRPRLRRRPGCRRRRCGACTDIGPISSGVNTPSPPPSTIAGPPMPMLVSAVAMITSQQPSSDALPAKQRPETIADQRHQARAAGAKWWNVGCRARMKPPHVGRRRGRPPPPSANSTSGMRPCLGDLEHAVGLPVVVHALGAGEHGVVVGHHATRAWRARRTGAVDAADAGDQAVGRGCDQQIVERARGGAARRRPAGRTRRRCRGRTRSSTFSRAVRWSVLRRRATASGRRRRASARGAPAPRPGRGGCDRGRRSSALATASPRPRRLDEQRAAGPRRPCRRASTAMRRTTPPTRRRDDVLHLHRFHHGELLRPPDQRRPRDGERDDRALHRRADREHAVGQIRAHRRRRRPCLVAASRLAVGEHGERVDGVDLRAGLRRVAARSAAK